MSADELRAWMEAAAEVRHHKATSPCVDCPMAFHLAEKAAGRCARRPSRRGIPTGDRRNAHNAANRRYRLARARAMWDNDRDGSSVQSHRLPTDARDSATTRGAGVAAPLEVVAR